MKSKESFTILERGMNNNEKDILVLLLVIIILGVGLVYAIRLNVTNQNDFLQGSIIRQSDKSALNRMNTLYERFLNHKGDYLMIIGTTIDSGPAITNINLNDNELVWIYDRSQDKYSDGAVDVYRCKKMTKEEDNIRTVFSVSNCEGYSEDDIKGSIQFPNKH